MAEIHHKLGVRAALGALELDVAVDLRAPWTVLFGASGSGKSSVLRAAAGLLPGAEVLFERWAGSSSGAWVDMVKRPVHGRDLGYSPQGAAVFPHLSVQENVGFGMAVCSSPAKDATLVEEAMTLFRLHEMSGRRTAELSGGEGQRVALARAFATPGVKLMLLDEPFVGMDRRLRDELLPEMRAALARRGIACLSVTHDVEEALLLEAEVVRLEAGSVAAVGAARAVLAGERERMLAALG